MGKITKRGTERERERERENVVKGEKEVEGVSEN